MSTDTRSQAASAPRPVAGWRIDVIAGPSEGRVLEAVFGPVSVGSASDNDLVLADPAVSRRHLTIEFDALAAHVTDVGSKNGTFLEGVKISTAVVPTAGSCVVVGDSVLAIWPDAAPRRLRPSVSNRCGRLLGSSEPMRLLFAQVERVAGTPATVLIHGETGTGKELVAEAIHDLGPRKTAPFVVLDCSAIPKGLSESELFGHVRGAFTGAIHDHRGAFARADGGTLFLDEVAELDLETQPKLLRVLETGEFRPVGSERAQTVDVRIVAASHRDLADEVSDKRFREDLYYRLAVVTLRIPPLRARREDIPQLAAAFLADMGAPALPPGALKAVADYAWPGNVRQLRNALERAVSLAGEGAPMLELQDLEAPSTFVTPSELLKLPYKDAKGQLVDGFTRDYLEALLARNEGNVSAAAREAKIDRNWIVALARKHGIRVRD